MTPNPKPYLPCPKEKPYRSKKHRKAVEKLPCCACGEPYSDRVAHHENPVGWGTMAGKCDDDRCLPMCQKCHLWRHQYGRDTFWTQVGKDPEKLIEETNRMILG